MANTLNSAAGGALPILTVPTCDVGTATTVAALLTADVEVDKTTFNVRRVRVLNKDDTAYIGLLIVAAGASLSGLTLDDSIQVAPGDTLETEVHRDLRIGIVSDSSAAFSFCISDV